MLFAGILLLFFIFGVPFLGIMSHLVFIKFVLFFSKIFQDGVITLVLESPFFIIIIWHLTFIIMVISHCLPDISCDLAVNRGLFRLYLLCITCYLIGHLGMHISSSGGVWWLIVITRVLSVNTHICNSESFLHLSRNRAILRRYRPLIWVIADKYQLLCSKVKHTPIIVEGGAWWSLRDLLPLCRVAFGLLSNSIWCLGVNPPTGGLLLWIWHVY